MKKILLILSVLVSAICFAQPKVYIRGDSIFLLNATNTAHVTIQGTLRLNDGTQVNGYVLTTDANGNATWQPASGGGGTPGSPNTSIQRNLNGVFSGTDSLVVDANGVQSKYNVIIGNNVGTSLSNLTVRGNAGNAIANFGPPNKSFSNGFWYNNYAIDSNVTAVSANHPLVGGVSKSIGQVNYRETDIATASGLEFRFTYGQYNQWRINLNDSLYQNAQNLDGAFASGSILSYYRHTGKTGKSVLYTGSLTDGPSAHFAQVDFQGSGGGNYYYVNGHLYGISSYLFSSANGLDTIRRFSAFNSGAAGSLTPYVEEWKDAEFGGLGGMPSSHVGKAYGVYVYNRTGGLTLNYFAGPTGFGSGNVDPTANVDILGTLKYVDGNQSAGRVLTTDGSGNATWQDASGGSSLFPVTGTGTATGDVTGDLDGHNLDIINGDNINLSATGAIDFSVDDGVTEKTEIIQNASRVRLQWQNNAETETNRFDVLNSGLLVTIPTGKTFESAIDGSADYTDRSFPDFGSVKGLAFTFTNKTITSSTNTLGAVTMGLGSDATGDIYYRNSGGVLTRLPIGTTRQKLSVVGGLPAWVDSTAGGSAAGSTTQIQYNSSGAFAGSAGLTWINGSNLLAVTGTNSNLSTMPNMRYMYTGDANAALSYTLYAHDNMSIDFDAWYDPANGWTSSDATANFALYKNSGRLYIGVNSGTAASSTFGGFIDVWGVAAATGNIAHKAGQLVMGGSSAVASAKLEIISTTQGFLPPRMTTTQKNAISSPATGLVVYDTTLNKLCVYTGAGWETVTSL